MTLRQREVQQDIQHSKHLGQADSIQDAQEGEDQEGSDADGDRIDQHAVGNERDLILWFFLLIVLSSQMGRPPFLILYDLGCVSLQIEELPDEAICRRRIFMIHISSC